MIINDNDHDDERLLDRDYAHSNSIKEEALNRTILGGPDKLLEGLYKYYHGGGLVSLLLARISTIAIFGFMQLFVLYLSYGVNWRDPLQSCTSLLCVFRNMTFFGWLAYITTSVLLTISIVKYYVVEREKWFDCKAVYRRVLGLRDSEMRSLDWDHIMDLVIRKGLVTGDKLNICARLMRRENYLIAMFSKGLLDFDLNVVPFSIKYKVPLSKPLEWALVFCLFGFIFNPDTCELSSVIVRMKTREEVDAVKERLRKRTVIIGFLMLIAAPLVFGVTIVYLVFRYGEQAYRNPSSLFTRQYTQSARWHTRQYNELPHYFEKRLRRTIPDGTLLVQSRKDPRIVSVCRLLSFMSGSLFLILLVMGVVYEDLFKTRLLSWMAVLGAILTVSNQYKEPVDCDYNLIVKKLEEDLGPVNALALTSWLRVKARILLDDLLGCILAPIVLLTLLPQKSSEIIDFVREFTIHVHPLGYVCSYSVFKCLAGHFNTDGTMADQKLDQSVMGFAKRHTIVSLSIPSTMDGNIREPTHGTEEDISLHSQQKTVSIVGRFYN